MSETECPDEQPAEAAGRSCPQCGRPAAVQDRDRCAWCGTVLPWAKLAESGLPADAMNEEEIAAILERAAASQEALPQGVTYPKACPACAELLPESLPEVCPNCHTAVRDPYTGRLVYDRAKPSEEQSRVKRLALILGSLTVALILLAFCAAILGSILKSLPPPRR